MVIQGGSFKGGQRSGGDLKPKEVVSLLLDDEEIETRVKMKVEEEQEKTPKDKVETRITRKREAENTKDEEIVKRVKVNLVELGSDDDEQRLADPKPLFDFAGDKMGPKKVKGRGGGKRGRPRGSGRGRGERGQGGLGGPHNK